VLYCLTLSFAPPFGVVVLIQTLPVGAELVSAVLNAGTAVCAAASILAELYVPATSPNAANNAVPVPSAIVMLPSAVPAPAPSLSLVASA
jgi:hypothetical protein